MENEAPRSEPEPRPIPAGTTIGHAHLKVSNLERSLAFYHGILGFEVQEVWRGEAAFISAGGYHHHIGLNTWESRGGQKPPPGTTGLYHVAILYPTRKDLADALMRLIENGYPLTGASDHGVSEAIYLDDPDGNGLELYRDRPKDEWPRREDGSIAMYNRHFDLEKLLSELGEEELNERWVRARARQAEETTGPKDLA